LGAVFSFLLSELRDWAAGAFPPFGFSQRTGNAAVTPDHQPLVIAVLTRNLTRSLRYRFASYHHRPQPPPYSYDVAMGLRENFST
jgi:hypothetical protein